MFKISLFILLALVIFVILDLLWFSVAGNFFKSQVGALLRLTVDGQWNVRYVPALLTYVLMAIGLVIFALPLASNIPQALLYGGLFGLVCYGIYDMTNLAILSGWTIRFALVDMAWGTVANAAVLTILTSFKRFLS